MERLRLLFAKKEPIKYIAHLDLMLAWERALRRAQVPLAYSQGFNPRPKMQLASGLPLGTTGTAEIMDIFLTEPVDLATALARLRTALPSGMAVHTLVEVPLKSPTLQHLLRQADYTVTVETDLTADELNKRISNLLERGEVLQVRQRKQQTEQINLRPWVHQLQLIGFNNGDAHLAMRLTTGQLGNLRPQEVLKAMDLGDNWAQIERTGLIFEESPNSDLIGFENL